MKAIKKQQPLSLGDSGHTKVDTRELASLAEEMILGDQRVQEFQRRLQLSEDEKKILASDAALEARTQQMLDAAPGQVTWASMHALARLSPDLAIERWQSIQQAASDELSSGHRGAKALEKGRKSNPMERARYLALRQELASEWHPRNGIEWTLIDQMAQSYTLYLHWLAEFNMMTALSCKSPSKEMDEWEAPRVTEAQAIEVAGAMVERFQRLFLRTLRALRDLRRYPVIVQNAGQVNVGEQQVNVVHG